MILIPEYVIEHYPQVRKWLRERLTFAEQEELAAGTLSQFDCGMGEHQRACSVAWMRHVLADQGISEMDAAQRLAIDRGTLNRWINGRVDPPFAQWQRFYACFGGRHKDDHPLRPREALNLGGYLRAVAHVRDWLGRRGGEQANDPASPPPTLETFLCLHYFYADKTPADALSWMDDPHRQRFVESVNRRIAKLPTLTPADFQRASVRWGWAWLICLTQLSDAEGDSKQYVISAKRPVLIDAAGKD